jgi:adenosylcobinamide-GDP ribazoletransferase
MRSRAGRSFVIAWQFLTAIPLNRHHHDPAPAELAASMAWYSVVGLLLGGVLALTAWLLSGLVARVVLDALLIVLLVAVTRGLHQDGLADTLDGWAGGRTPEQRLAIMRDGRIGAIGATGLILALGLRYAGLAALPELDRLPILLCMPAVGRWAMVVGAVALPYARAEGGLAESFLQNLTTRHVLIATLGVAAALVFAMGPVGAVVSLSVTALVARAVSAHSRRLCGGVTGDTLGATNEVAEIAFLLLAPTLVRMG